MLFVYIMAGIIIRLFLSLPSATTCLSPLHPSLPCKKNGFCFNLQCIKHNVLCVILSVANEDTGDLFVSECIKRNVLRVILLVANEDKGDLFVSG